MILNKKKKRKEKYDIRMCRYILHTKEMRETTKIKEFTGSNKKGNVNMT
jgi:hypothetical protein